LARSRAPTLVIHGTDDPRLPLPHGQMLAREIPGARLLPLDGVKHEEPPPQTWDVVVPAILEHTEAG
jgi:pimeloyl-ACP methyl ester carboxylesterase